jgi:hypothetical protein
MRRVAVSVAVIVAAGAVAVTALAQTGRPFSVPVADREGDKGLDVVKASLGRDDKGRLVGEVALAKNWGAGALRHDGPAQGSVCLRLFTARVDDAEPPDYLVCVTAPAEGDELVGRVLRDLSNGLPRTVGAAVVTRPDRRTVRLRFTQKAIKKPERVRFSAEAVKYGSKCRPPLGCRDHAPDLPSTISIRLR